MADTFKLQGTYLTDPNTGTASGDPALEAPIDEQDNLARKHFDTVKLEADAAETISFGDVANAHVVIMRATGGKVKAEVTSADGSTQSIPFDPLLILISKKTPITAIDLTREAGKTTTVKTFLGQRS